jgi:hypothetical protein
MSVVMINAVTIGIPRETARRHRKLSIGAKKCIKFNILFT